MSGPAKLVEECYLQTERQPDGRRMLLRDLAVEVDGQCVNVRQGFVTDFSSIPPLFGFVVHWSRVDIAGVVHDYLYSRGTVSRREADRMWFQVAISGDHRASRLQAWVCWLAILCFGWIAWNQHRSGS